VLLHDLRVDRTTDGWGQIANFSTKEFRELTTLGSSPQKMGAKMIVYDDGTTLGTIGGGNLEYQIIAEARKCLETGAPRISAFNLGPELAMCCGGKVEVLIEPMMVEDKFYIFGAGHIGKELAPLALKLGMDVTVIDEREEFARIERFPKGCHLIADRHEVALRQISLDAHSFVTICTHRHDYDSDILAQVLPKETAYVGMIGSRSKLAKAKLRLRTQGVSETLFHKIHTPMGLDIGAVSPFEIALSIAAEITAIRRK
jgi:xanthine dehydrogenase accessory factor